MKKSNYIHWINGRNKEITRATIHRRNLRLRKEAIQKKREQMKLDSLIEKGRKYVGNFPKGTLFCLSENGTLLVDFTKCNPEESKEFIINSNTTIFGSPINRNQFMDRCSGTFMR